MFFRIAGRKPENHSSTAPRTRPLAGACEPSHAMTGSADVSPPLSCLFATCRIETGRDAVRALSYAMLEFCSGRGAIPHWRYSPRAFLSRKVDSVKLRDQRYSPDERTDVEHRKFLESGRLVPVGTYPIRAWERFSGIRRLGPPDSGGLFLFYPLPTGLKRKVKRCPTQQPRQPLTPHWRPGDAGPRVRSASWRYS